MSFTYNSFVKQAITAVEAGSEKALKTTVLNVAKEAKSNAPVDLGQLKGSIMWKTQKASGLHTDGARLSEPVKGMSAIVGTAVEYGVYQEYGTRFMSAKPFLRTAVNIVVGGLALTIAVKKAMYDTVREKLSRISGGFS